MKTPPVELTLPLDGDTPVFSEGDYRDPLFRMTDWCTVPDRGFWVSRIEMGTQTGTHIDAPAHFVPGAETLDALPLAALIGPYFRFRLSGTGEGTDPGGIRHRYRGESLLLLQCEREGARIDPGTLSVLLDLGCRVWVAAAEVSVAGGGPWAFNRRLAEAGVFLVEGVNDEAASRLSGRGILVVLPLRLQRAGGSPCRVVALPEAEPSGRHDP